MYIKLFVIYVTILQTKCELDQRVITTLKYSTAYVQPTIVRGKPAVSGQIPYLVSIKDSRRSVGHDRKVWENLCGGSIISEFRVLTAAHCFDGQKYFYARNPQHIRVVAGNLRTAVTHSGRTETNAINQWRNATKIIMRHDYLFPNNDLAIVFVNQKWKFRSNVDYIVTASQTTDYTHLCMASGFGRIGFGNKAPVSPIMLVAKIVTMPKWQCSRLWGMNMNSFVCSASSFADVSRGDSGGPLACKNTLDPKEKPNRDLLVGVVSGKNFDRTTLYTRVSAYKDWIDSDRGPTLSINLFFIITVAVLIYLLFSFTSPILVLFIVTQKVVIITNMPNERLTFRS